MYEDATILIRAATAADLPTIGQLGALLVTLHHDLDAARFLAPSPETPTGYAEFLGTQLGEANAGVLVAVRAGQVIGYAYVTMEGTDWMTLRGPAGVLHDIVVDPACRGAGVGHHLLGAALAWFRARQAPRVVLGTAARNVAAQRLFEGAGFRRTMVEMTREL